MMLIMSSRAVLASITRLAYQLIVVHDPNQSVITMIVSLLK